jgi:ABC-type multidrug transport system fused ATPase/permease subunit
MSRKLPSFVRTIIKTTSFWKENYLILREIRNFPRIAALVIICPLIAAAFEGFGIGFLFGFLQTLVSPGAVPFQTGIEWFDIWVLGINMSEMDRLLRVSALILISTWIRILFSWAGGLSLELSKTYLAAYLQKRVFEQLQSLALSFFGKTQSGEIVNTLTNEVNNLQQAIQAGGSIISRGLVLIVYILVLLSMSWQLSLISALLLSLLITGLSTLNGRVREASFPVSRTNGRFTSIAIEFVNAIRTVQAFATQDFERRKFYQAKDDVVRAATRVILLRSVVRPLAEGLATSILVGMIVLGIAVFVANGTLTTASLLTFLFVLFRTVPVIQEINGGFISVSSFQGSIKNVEKLLKTDDKPYLKNGNMQFTGLKRSIEFISVDFSYDLQNPILHTITLTITKGQTVALVGASGAGKTTLADLIPRFYDPTQGEILVDGIDLRQYEINSVRRKMAIVSQDTFIFNASVRDNIAYGLEGVDDSAILEVSQLANALEFIRELPEGLNTQLGDRGVRLSGGQRQRIAIARALLRNPEILILDEATSALDSVAERLIQESIEKLSVGRTVIAIAHRLSTIVRADKVVVLEQGRIVEQGTYQELLAQRGKLWKYHQMQHEVGSAS